MTEPAIAARGSRRAAEMVRRPADRRDHRRGSRSTVSRAPPPHAATGACSPRRAQRRSADAASARRPAIRPPARPVPLEIAAARRGCARAGAALHHHRRARGGHPRLRGLRAQAHRQEHGVRRRRGRRAGHGRGRGAGRRRGPAGQAVRRRERPADGPHVRRHRHEPRRATSTSPTSCSGGRPATARRRWPSRRSACAFTRRHIELARPKVLVLAGRHGGQGRARHDRGHHAPARQVDQPDASTTAATCRRCPTFHPAYLLRTPASKRQSWLDLLALDKKLRELGIR